MKSCSLLYAKRTSSCRVIVFVWLSSNQKLEVETCFVCNCFAMLYSDKICTLHLSGSKNDKIENLPSLLWSFRNCINEILYLAQNMVGYLSANIICSGKRIVYALGKLWASRNTVQGQISEHIFKIKWRLLCSSSFATRAVLKIGE